MKKILLIVCALTVAVSAVRAEIFNPKMVDNLNISAECAPLPFEIIIPGLKVELPRKGDLIGAQYLELRKGDQIIYKVEISNFIMGEENTEETCRERVVGKNGRNKAVLSAFRAFEIARDNQDVVFKKLNECSCYKIGLATKRMITSSVYGLVSNPISGNNPQALVNVRIPVPCKGNNIILEDGVELVNQVQFD